MCPRMQPDNLILMVLLESAMKKTLATLFLTVIAAPAFAGFDEFDVPEISALDGAAALAVVAAVVLLVWERRRQA